MATDTLYDAFLSYARADDEPFVQRLHDDLVKQGLRIWWDRRDMSNPALTYLQVIRDHIDKSNRMIAVIGPHALESDYVCAEWEHARLFAKGVIAIPRLSGFEDIPKDFARYHGPDFRQETRYNDALRELVRLLKEPVAPLGALSGVPALPPYFVTRSADLEALADLVLADIRRAVTLEANVFSIYGMPGSGKSVLAAAFARAVDTRRAFHEHGVVWVHVGQQPRLGDIARTIGAAFVEDVGPEAAIGYARLQRLLEGKLCLIVLDDVWDIGHVEQTMSAMGARMRLLVTTRHEDLATALGPHYLALSRVSNETGSRMLEAYSGKPVASWTAEAFALLRECGNLPLALALTGSWAREGIAWADLRDALRSADLRFIEKRLPQYDQGLVRAQQASVNQLEASQPGSAERYLDLVVFPSDEAIPKGAVFTLWSAAGVTGREASKLLITLRQKSLIELTGTAPNQTVSMHDLQHDFLRATLGEMQAARHQRLLDAYRPLCGGMWARGPDDGYFFQHLPRHVLAGTGAGELERLLFDFEWLQAKLDKLGIVAVIEDFALEPDERSPLRYLEDLLRRSALTLQSDPGQLAGQLLGRIGRFRMEDQLDHLVAAAHAWRGRAWLRPLNGTLESPGSALRAILAGHEGTPRSLAITPDGKWGASAGNSAQDQTVRIWDLHKGVLVRILVAEAESGGYTPLALTADGRMVVCANGALINGWEIRTGKLLYTLERHEACVQALAIDEAGDRLLSGSTDGALVLWDLETRRGEPLGGYGEPALAIALAPDGTRAAILSESTLERWHLDARSCDRLTVAPEGREPGWTHPPLALSEDGESVYFGSPLRMWTPRTGETRIAMDPGARILSVAARSARVALVTHDRETLEIWDCGPSPRARADLPNQLAEVSCVAITPDGQHAIVGFSDHLARAWDLGIVPPLGVKRGGDRSRAEVTRIDVSIDGCHAVTLRASGDEWVWNLESGESWRYPVGHEAVLREAHERRAAEQGLVDRWKVLCQSDPASKVTPRIVVIAADGTAIPGPSPERWSVKAVHVDCAIAIGPEIDKTGECVEPDEPPDQSDRDALRLCRCSDGLSTPVLLRGHSLPVRAVAISCDGRVAISGGVGRTLRVWDLASATQKHMLRAHRDTITAVALLHDAHIAVSASNDRTVRVWDLMWGQLLATFTGELKMTTCALSPDSRTVIAGDGSGKVHVLRVERR